MTAMISGPRIVRRIAIELWACFVHRDGAAIHEHAIQGAYRRPCLRRLRHPDKREAPRFSRIPVADEGNCFDGSVDCEHVS